MAKILGYKDKLPEIGKQVFLADGSIVVGDVSLGDDVSVWFNTVIRGDVHYIRIGARTNVQDLSMLHVTHDTHPLIIGEGVTIGHNVVLHGCTIEDYCLIGMGAIVMDGAVIGHHSIVGAGAVVTGGKVFPPYSMIIGSPATLKRELNDKEKAGLEASAQRYVNYKNNYLK